MKPRPSITLCMLLGLTGTGAALADPAQPAPVDDVITVNLEAVEAPAAPAAPQPGVPLNPPQQFKFKLARPADGGTFTLPALPPQGVAAPGRRVVVVANPNTRPLADHFAAPIRALFLADPAGGEGPGRDVFFYAAGAIEMKKVAYLGVSTSPVAASLASHLKLPPGFGLIVDHAQPDEPAAKAGLKPHDVIIRIGDQKLVNSPQLGTLVRAQKPGDEIELTIIREGKEMTVKAKLVEKEMPLGMIGDGMGGGAGFEVLMPTQLADKVDWQPATPIHGFNTTRLPGAMKYADDEHQLEVTLLKDTLNLVVKDKNGKEIFKGPITTPQERLNVPAAVLPKLEKLEKSTRVTITHSVEPGALPNLPGVPGLAPGAFIEVGKPFDAEALKSMIESSLKSVKLEGAQGEQLQKQIDEVKKQIDEMMKKQELHRAARGALNPLGVLGGEGSLVSVLSMNDGTYSLTVKSDGKSKHLTARDKDGKELFAGPISTDEELAKVPAEIRERLQMMERATKVGVNLGPAGRGAAALPETRKPANKEDDR